MDLKHVEKIAEEFSFKTGQVQAVAELLDDGATVPFIARYRKEATGELDEVAITSIRDRLAQLEELDKRRVSILQSLEERELLTDELKESILAAETLSKLEDIYLPFRPKRRTRATIAMEKGLEPLAEMIFQQDASLDPASEASAFVDEEKGVESADDALAGARDIIAEWVNQDQDARAKIRMLFEQKGVIRSRVIINKEEEGAKFRDYFEWEELAANAPSHRILAIRRGENEGFLTMRIAPPEEEALALLEEMFVKGESLASDQVRDAVTDSYKRLLSLSMETEMRLMTKDRADLEAIRVFGDNLRELLLAAPLGQKTILAIDPGFRTGCKVVCLDRQGGLKHIDVIHPFGSDKQKSESTKAIMALVEAHNIEAIAVGNGTAGTRNRGFY
jgi:uncharacterized protein